MMPWQMQLNFGDKGAPVWRSIHGSDPTKPYEYDTEEEAEHMLNVCYPDQCRLDRLDGERTLTRVIEVTHEDQD